jgi:tRNA pseudouridine38-40 synthase
MVTRLLIEYDGGPFAGWAKQPGRRTIQDELERALETVLREPAELTVAGRTDAGVHATGQVASYVGRLPELRSVNALLPDEIAVLSAEVMPDGFSARHQATSRAYCYRVLHRPERSAFEHGRALWWPHRIDLDALDACAAAIAGAHDFTAFTPTETEHVRFERVVTHAAWERHGDVLEFWIEADAFMRHMNRVLVGTMLDVASERRTGDDFRLLLRGMPRAAAGTTAPARGLFLVGVGYHGEPVLGADALEELFLRVRGGRP